MPSISSPAIVPRCDYIYRSVNKRASGIYICVSSCARVIVIAASMAVAAATPLAAKEREPEPIESPGDCPIDAPVRVASVDSLRHFEGLIAHCPETMMIEAPAFRDTRPKADVRLLETELERGGNLEQPLGRPSNSITVASASAGAAPPRSSDGRRGAQANFVAIAPPASAFAPSSAVIADHSATDGQADVEAILALRPQSYATGFDEKIASAARVHRVDPLLLHAVIKQESGYRQRAVSPAGARGLMQVMPATGRSLGVADPQSLFDADVNIAAGAKLLSSLWQRFDGDVDLVLAAYNAGEGAVMKYGRAVPPYRETRDYVAKVKANYRSLASESGIVVQF